MTFTRSVVIVWTIPVDTVSPACITTLKDKLAAMADQEWPASPRDRPGFFLHRSCKSRACRSRRRRAAGTRCRGIRFEKNRAAPHRCLE